MRAAQLQIRLQVASRVPFIVLVLGAFIVWLLWDHQPHAWLLAWWAAASGIQFVRWMVFKRFVAPEPTVTDTDTDTGHWIAVLTAFSLVGGLVSGSAGWLFFSGSPLVDQALLTMVLVSWSAMAIGTNSALPWTFTVFALPLLGPLAIGWFLSDVPGRNYIGGIVVFLIAVQLMIAHVNSRQVLRSIAMRMENLRLIEQLRLERAEANAARETAEAANRAKSRFLAAASHDLRQPMHALSLYSAALSGTVTQPRVQKIANNIGVCVESLDSLFEALLDISRLDAGLIVPQIRTIAIQTLLDRLRTEFAPPAQGKGLALIVGRHAGHLQTDPVMVERIVRNLLDNAVRYTHKGSITLAVRDRPDGLEISVSDTGIGVHEEEKERIFEEFHRIGTDPPDARTPIGLGLGLATVRRMARLLGGTVSLESAPGEGSTFTLTLADDRRKETEPLPAAATSPTPIDLRERLVLVIEDDPRSQDAMRAILSAWGCDCLIAATIAEALAAVQTSPRVPDLMLVDFRLGNGVTGIEAIQAIGAQLGAQLGQIPAIMITGATDLREIAEAQGARHRLLHKPLKAALLRTEIERLLAGDTAGDAGSKAPAPG